MSSGFFHKLVKSFGFAFSGLIQAVKSEPNLKIHFTAVAVVTIAGFVFKISMLEWLIVLLIFALIISLELLNTAVENLCDLIDPQYNPKIKKIKDISAGAVLFSSIIALIAGIIIFAPKIIFLLK